jgi:hypothetical protein
VINISNYTDEGNTARPAWPGIPARAPRAAARPGAPGRALATAGLVLLSWLGGLPRRLGDRLFFTNDAEAYWREWQIIRTYGGLGRRYRDPRFATLAECRQCSGTGVTAAPACPACTGTGRITLGEAS